MIELSEPLLTLPAAARLLGRDPGTVRGWAAQGLLETVTLGKRRYTTRTALQAMADAGGKGRGRTPAQRRRGHERAMAELRARGLV